MAKRPWYSLVLIVAVVIITAGAAFSIPSLRGWRIWGPLAKARASVATKPAALPKVAPVAPSQQTTPAPTPDAVAVSTPAPAKNTPKKWAPSDKQHLRDVVYLAGKENRPADAIAALEGWDAKHPGDTEAIRELARLLARNSRSAEAFLRYRQLLALLPDNDTRTEYADALLAMQQYDSAAANYRILIDADTASASAHLGLARSLAWANHSREAEPELHWLVGHAPSDTLLVSMLHIARGAYDPSSAEGSRWVSEDPSFAPYRLALARAYMREQRANLSAAHFDTLLAGNSAAPLSLVREAAGAHAAAGDSIGNARLLRRALSLAPNDPAARQSYADALSWSGDRAAAIAQYDTLLAAHPDADLLMVRGRLYAWSGNNALAARDVAASAALHPTAVAFATLGDLYRWRGDRVQARESYTRARVLNPGDAQATAGLASIDLAEQREAESFFDRDVGFIPYFSFLGDNAGFELYSGGLGGGIALGSRAALTFTADERRLNGDNGQAGDIGLVSRLGSFRLAADGGFTHYTQTGDFGFGSLTATGPLSRVWSSFGVRTGPAYQWLMTSRRLTYTGGSASVTVPFRWAAISAGVDQMWLSDGNGRTSLQFGARYPLGFGISALYSGGMIGFNRSSELYWDPHRFTSHAVGLELATHSDSGLSFSARVLPGIGMSTDVVNGSSDPADRRAGQLSTGFALDYRRRWWTLTLDGDYAQGVRESHYHSARAGFRLRITP
jgi:tetratricopeptide (TPR) repeat protein